MKIETVTLREHLSALREADQRAIQIKETADERALLLAREIQNYKDEKANELRSQIEGERNLYATHQDLKVVTDSLQEQKGISSARFVQILILVALVAAALASVIALVHK
jgi:vacuolar-type H+-ATPase subunit H